MPDNEYTVLIPVEEYRKITEKAATLDVILQGFRVYGKTYHLDDLVETVAGLYGVAEKEDC